GKGGPESLSPKEEGEVHHGADDNASGTAGLLELAEAFASQKDFLKRSVCFIAFSGEEEGTLGSNFFVKNPTVPFEKITAMVNMDMIGRMKDSTIVVQGAGTSPIWKELVGGANDGIGLKVKFTDDGYGPSDHSPFYAKEKPVLFFFSGTHTDYHKPSDTWDKINAVGEKLVLQLAYRTVDKIQGSDAPPVYARTKGDSVRMGGESGELRAYLGTIPDYSEELVGVKLSGVREGSPAEKAGIKGGDVIVRFGSKEIRNIYDYTYALGAYKPGDKVEIGLVREGKALTVSVLLDRRR
ncbi:MAG TPA: M20/M25/M40 family metallo-hydrolase, partial [candidate division Zixibacteria bacterium]|nr:M20/M25/M40 family metallo-hydrolase [candidate division Zixibacteria bacterium]